ncbi:MAG: homocysteine S-methyltransferase family protein [Lysobacterales bacterium]
MKSIFNRLPKGLILLDGGMGQELIKRKASGQGVLWSAKALFDNPAAVQAVHEDYIRAGADIITTNSYACIRNNFEPEGLADRLGEMNELSAMLARRARDRVGKAVLIAGSMGPQNGSYRPDLVGSYDETVALYREQAEYLAPYIDFFICETLSCITEARAAVAAAASTGRPVWLSWSIEDSGAANLRSGESLRSAWEGIAGMGVEAVLLNCSPPEAIGKVLPDLVAMSDIPVGAYANAFTPIPEKWDFHGEQSIPPSRTDVTPQAYAAHAANWLTAGARIIGGCCEVGPAHIAYLNETLR